MDHNEENYDDWNDPMFEGLSEIEKIEQEEELIALAFNNSYSIITKEVTFDELIIRNEGSIDGVTTVAHDIESGPTNNDLENIIIYFQEREEYEKCAVLHKILTA